MKKINFALAGCGEAAEKRAAKVYSDYHVQEIMLHVKIPEKPITSKVADI